MKRLLFIVNPNAGKTAIKNDIFDIVLTFQRGGYETVIYPTTGPEDAERKVVAEGANYDLIVCAGGDGTLNNTVNGYMHMGGKKTPIGYIPVGTTNDFARGLCIPNRPVEAAELIMRSEPVKIDVGSMGDKEFVYVAAFGAFTDISYSTSQSMKKVMGHTAYILEGIRSLANYKAITLKAYFDDMMITGDYLFGMITNSFSVGGFKLRGTKHVLLNDGKFDCFFVKWPRNPAEVQNIVSALMSNEFDNNEHFFMTKAAKITIESEQEIAWTLDGESGGSFRKTEITDNKKALELMIDINIAKGIAQRTDVLYGEE